MHIKSPIFIIGSGRSGTTLLYHLLARHPEVCWFSNIVNSNPNHPGFSIINRFEGMTRLFDKKESPAFDGSFGTTIRPSEGENIYDHYGFSDAYKTCTITKHIQADEFKAAIEIHLNMTGKTRFLNKRTANTQRLGVLQMLFPDAYYIHIIRDGRAVALSLLKSTWWKDTPIWWLNGKRPSRIRQRKGDEIKLCALHWRQNIDEIRRQGAHVSSRYMEIRYEDLVSDVRHSLSQIASFCRLSNDGSFFRQLPRQLPSMNNKWKESLSSRQRAIINVAIGPLLTNLGYSS